MMTKTLATTLGIFLILVLASAPAAAAQESRKSTTVWDGVYTAAQAERGKEAYAAQCSSCHSADLSGQSAPPLKGDAFMENWREDSVNSLFNFIRTRMPARAPGSLSEKAYIEILSYILSVNTFPAGPNELAAEHLGDIQIVGKDGPAPIPKFALITVVGCLIKGGDNEWKLEKVSAPVRTRQEKPTPEELEISRTRPLGTSLFRLVYIDDLRPAFLPEQHVGQKIHGHGYLLSNAKGEGLSVTWLQSIAADCNN